MTQPTETQLEKARAIIQRSMNDSNGSYAERLEINIATALAEAIVPVSEAAEICAEMARDAETNIPRFASKRLKSRYTAMNDALREAERRVRARIPAQSESERLSIKDTVDLEAGRYQGLEEAARLATEPYNDEVQAIAGDEPQAVGEKIAKALRARITTPVTETCQCAIYAQYGVEHPRGHVESHCAFAAAPSLSQWQPIESAPRRQLILIYNSKWDQPVRAESLREGELRWATGYAPTHWMPLPLSPKEQA